MTDIPTPALSTCNHLGCVINVRYGESLGVCTRCDSIVTFDQLIPPFTPTQALRDEARERAIKLRLTLKGLDPSSAGYGFCRDAIALLESIAEGV